MFSRIKPFLKKCDFTYKLALFLLYPLNLLLAQILKTKAFPNSVLHISYMVHVPYYTVQFLREAGMKADYLAIGSSPHWNKCDYQLNIWGAGFYRAIKEMIAVWTIAAKYETLHLHFMLPVTSSGWELPILKKMGRKIVVHYRGCEVRDWQKNMQMYPKMNICQKCDYKRQACSSPAIVQQRQQARIYGDLFLATTPDLLDFAPEAVYFPFFSPDESVIPFPKNQENKTFKIVHATNHPGIEGTEDIQATMEKLKTKGYPIEFVFLKGKSYQEVLQQYATADLAIGKMKMGHYANSQIESMICHVPTVTYVRPEYMTPELHQSGFIISSLDDLETTLEHYLTHPHELQKKKEIARQSILQLHDNKKLTATLVEMYKKLHKHPK